MKSVKPPDIALLVLRLVVGAILVYAGSQKAFGLFGGPGFEGAVESFAKMGFSKPLAVLAMGGELLGGLGLVFGALTRLAAFGAGCTMAVAAYKIVSAPGTWQKLMQGESGALSAVGFPLVLFAGALAILLQGGGNFCIDRLVFRKRKRGS